MRNGQLLEDPTRWALKLRGRMRKGALVSEAGHSPLCGQELGWQGQPCILPAPRSPTPSRAWLAVAEKSASVREARLQAQNRASFTPAGQPESRWNLSKIGGCGLDESLATGVRCLGSQLPAFVCTS